MRINLKNLLDKVGDVALRRRAMWLIQSLDLKNGDKILDVGCGDGFYLNLLANSGLSIKLTGIDTNIKALKSAEVNLEGEKFELIQADVLKLPFANATFDKIIASEVLEHVYDDESAVKEIKRVLKPNGVFVLSVPHINYPFFWDPINWTLEHLLDIHIQSGFWAGIWNQHKRLYSDTLLKSVLHRGGFDNIKTEKLTHYCLPFNHHLINLVARILVYKKTPKIFRSKLSKFNAKEQNNKSSFNPFWILFRFDRMNDCWGGEGGAVSLVAVALK